MLSASSPVPVSEVAPDPAMLLVLLPAATGPLPAPPLPALAELQRRLGPAIRVLRVDEARHPAVVRSFAPTQLPVCVLVRRGVELWRQPGLPTDVPALLEAAHQ